ncbi:MAG: FAD-binding oxidoreductase [Proteobacteria bacterium]|nr:FAD-binding oxidoreductase [Pseudomonadota bacterium]
MMKNVEVLVIGAGVRGLSIAYSLAKAGVDVMVIEKRFVAAGASGLNMGLVNISGKAPEHYTLLSLMSANMYPNFIEELGADIEYERNGSFPGIAKNPEDWERLNQVVTERNQVADINMRMMDINEMRELEPDFSPQLLGGAYCPVDGGVNALKLTRALARAGLEKGVSIKSKCEVLDIRVSSNRIESVVTSLGNIGTHVVVNAAGIHVPAIAKMIGVEVPIFPERGQLIITEALPKFLSRAVESYKQFADGQVLIGYANERVGENTWVTTEMISRFAKEVIQVFPILKQAKAIRCAAALRPMTPDRLPIFEKVADISDFYIAVGHSGITLAPLTGKVFSDLIITGQTDIPITEFGMERFHGNQI